MQVQFKDPEIQKFWQYLFPPHQLSPEAPAILQQVKEIRVAEPYLAVMREVLCALDAEPLTPSVVKYLPTGERMKPQHDPNYFPLQVSLSLHSVGVAYEMISIFLQERKREKDWDGAVTGSNFSAHLLGALSHDIGKLERICRPILKAEKPYSFSIVTFSSTHGRHGAEFLKKLMAGNLMEAQQKAVLEMVRFHHVDFADLAYLGKTHVLRIKCADQLRRAKETGNPNYVPGWVIREIESQVRNHEEEDED